MAPSPYVLVAMLSVVTASADAQNLNLREMVAGDRLKRVCDSDEGKAAVRAAIRSVAGSHGSADAMSLRNGMLSYAVPYSGHGPATVVTWLQNDL